MSDKKYLELLAKSYPTIQEASSEIINLHAILNLPKGTEHFLSDIHGEYRSVTHILRNASGVIKTKVEDLYGKTLPQRDRNRLLSLIYYPEQKLTLIKNEVEDMEEWYKINLYRLIEICRVVGSKYTRSKVRKAMPSDFAYIIDELLHNNYDEQNKQEYYTEIINAIVKTEMADSFIISISRLISRLSIDRLHIIGDIFDRGPRADFVMDTLINYHQVDIQWGNHDILWMGAAAGSDACIANVIAICAKYNNLETLEEGYGISMRPLSFFALDTYRDDPCERFMPRILEGEELGYSDRQLMASMHKAIAVIQFKLEAQLIRRRPEYGMDDRILLEHINYGAGTITVDGREYKLEDSLFPTIDPKNPLELTEDEAQVMEKLRSSFIHSDRLRKHVRFLYAKGGMYKRFNGNLLYHGCIPMDEDGSFTVQKPMGTPVSGKAYIEEADKLARLGYFSRTGTPERELGRDFLWYLWCGPNSPLFGKHRITTFERYFITDKTAHEEHKNPYYKYIVDEKHACNILEEFGLEPETSHIINGHVPVKIKRGESPVKAGGRLIVIDGGLSKAYQAETGIAGYTLIFNSQGLALVEHEPFEAAATIEEKDIRSTRHVVERTTGRLRVADTDDGAELRRQIEDLTCLLKAYRSGEIKEQK